MKLNSSASRKPAPELDEPPFEIPNSDLRASG